jgi:hypothetical protein
LAQRHLNDGTLLLYDVTSTWFEGRCCELGRLGYSRDGQRRQLGGRIDQARHDQRHGQLAAPGSA